MRWTRPAGSAQPKAIYCVPTIHNPTTATLSAARRQALAELAARHGVPIVEDDAYGALPSQPLPAVTSLAEGAGYYVGTLSKCLSPGLRTAFVVAPGPDGGAPAAGGRASDLAGARRHCSPAW